jgi:hypothetical protein
MIQNPITFVISNNGTILDAQRGTIRALSNYASKIYVVAPFESVSLRVNYLIYDIKREVIGQYLAPTSLKGKDVLSPNDTQFQTAGEWQVWEASISQRALHRIAKYRAGRIGVSFQVNTIGIPSQVAGGDYLGVLKTGSVLPNPASYSGTNGDHYIVDQYNYTDTYVTGELTKGDYVYFKQVVEDSVVISKQWLKGQNISQVAMTTTTDLAVDPSLLAELPEDISEDAELQDLIDELIGDVAGLQTDVNAHINDLDDPHDTQANQVDGDYRGEPKDVQDSIDTLTFEIDGIVDGDTPITYDPTADEIIDAITVAGAIGELDFALDTHIKDLDNPHDVNASQVDVTHQNETVSVQTAINDLQADKVEKNPSQYTNLLIESDQVYVKVGDDEQLITLTNLRSSIIDDVVAFGYVVFTEKDEDGQPIITSPQTNKIYLFNPSLSGGGADTPNDSYEEWIYILEDNLFEQIGTTRMDLINYYTKVQTDELLEIPLRLQLYPNTKNTSGTTIPKGAVVQFAGSQGDFSLIKQAVASEINANPSLLMGLARESIADNAFGDVVWFGNVEFLALGSFTTGQILWFDTVNGGLTATEPATNKIQIAAVQKASSNPSATNGILLVRVKYVSRDIDEVDGLTDALAGKSAVGHTHTKSEITDFAHTHLKADITDFAHTHIIADVSNLQTALDTVGQVDGFSTKLGFEASNNLTVGNRFSTALGYRALFSNTIGVSNIGIGFEALFSNTTGSGNLGQGFQAGRFIANGSTANQTGSNSIFIGAETKALANGQTNQIVIGNGTTGNGSNTATIGNDSITATYLKGAVSATTSVTTPSVVATSTVKIGSWTLSQNGTSGSLDFVVV